MESSSPLSSVDDSGNPSDIVNTTLGLDSSCTDSLKSSTEFSLHLTHSYSSRQGDQSPREPNLTPYSLKNQSSNSGKYDFRILDASQARIFSMLKEANELTSSSYPAKYVNCSDGAHATLKEEKLASNLEKFTNRKSCDKVFDYTLQQKNKIGDKSGDKFVGSERFTNSDNIAMHYDFAATDAMLISQNSANKLVCQDDHDIFAPDSIGTELEVQDADNVHESLLDNIETSVLKSHKSSSLLDFVAPESTVSLVSTPFENYSSQSSEISGVNWLRSGSGTISSAVSCSVRSSLSSAGRSIDSCDSSNNLNDVDCQSFSPISDTFFRENTSNRSKSKKFCVYRKDLDIHNTSVTNSPKGSSKMRPSEFSVDLNEDEALDNKNDDPSGQQYLDSNSSTSSLSNGNDELKTNGKISLFLKNRQRLVPKLHIRAIGKRGGSIKKIPPSSVSKSKSAVELVKRTNLRRKAVPKNKVRGLFIKNFSSAFCNIKNDKKDPSSLKSLCAYELPKRLVEIILLSNVKVLACDFDLTMIAAHSGGTVDIREDNTAIFTALSDDFNYFATFAQKMGLVISIVTFSEDSSSPHIIGGASLINEVLEKSHATFNVNSIYAFFPDDWAEPEDYTKLGLSGPMPNNKSYHLNLVAKEFQVEPQEIMLIDDSYGNCYDAVLEGYLALRVYGRRGFNFFDIWPV